MLLVPPYHTLYGTRPFRDHTLGNRGWWAPGDTITESTRWTVTPPHPKLSDPTHRTFFKLPFTTSSLFSSLFGDHDAPTDQHVTSMTNANHIFPPYLPPFLNPRQELAWLAWRQLYKVYIYPAAPSSIFRFLLWVLHSLPISLVRNSSFSAHWPLFSLSA